MTRRWSLRTRFVAAASVCLLPLLGVVFFVIDQSIQHSREQLLETEIAISEIVAQGLTEALAENESVLVELAKDNNVRAMAEEDAQRLLRIVRPMRPSLSGLFLLKPEREVVAFAGIDPEPLLAEFAAATDNALNAGQIGISDPFPIPGADADINVIALVHPVWADPEQTREGKPVGAIGSFLSVERLRRAFLPASKLPSSDTTIAIVAADRVIAEQPTSEGAPTGLSAELAAPIAEAIAGKRGKQVYHDANGAERLAVFTPVEYPAVKWAVVVTNPSPTTYSPNRSLIQNGLFALAAAVILTLILAVIFGEVTARPLRLLTEQATSFSGGDLDQKFQPVGRGEVATLSAAFADMANRLTTQVRDTEAAHEEVARQAELLRDLLRRTVRLQEDERRRIAAEIHDAVAPLITGALYQVRALKLSNGQTNGGMLSNGAGLQEELNTIAELLERAMEELHGVVFALRPPDLDDLGVVAAIERYVQQINRGGLPCRLEVSGEPQRLSPEARLGIYRIVQEALHNALRHAHADEAVVKMEWLNDKVRVTIRDNGSGFDPEQASRPTALGLLSMRERAAAIGATLEIASKPGAGTAIIIERPLGDDLLAEPGQERAVGAEPVAEVVTEQADVAEVRSP